ncbi:MAG TPA: DeoR/GlpR family DNA-binding transcription regulator [Planctomycetaceae bacterium]|nr:DeoR/GlpR family DNA-binding transcription regulator [Planctomycetaceae bacterium]
MLLDQRRDEILQLIEKQGFVSLQELVERLGASESTVRRDLERLDEIGQIRRTRGGAAYIGEHLTPFEERGITAQSEKQRIAKAVAEQIEPGDTVLLDGGTTTLEVARSLIGKSLQVVTNSLPIANLLVNQPTIELILIGGYLYPRTGVALGSIAAAALQGLHVRRVIMSAGGITERGLFNSNTLLVDCERQMFDAAEDVWGVADHTKFGRTALAHLCPLSTVHRYFVDSGLDHKWRETIRNAGSELTIVE